MVLLLSQSILYFFQRAGASPYVSINFCPDCVPFTLTIYTQKTIMDLNQHQAEIEGDFKSREKTRTNFKAI